MKKMKRQQQGFTLVEMITVLIVILMLAGAAMALGPVITKISNDAKTRTLLKSVSLAMEQYRASGLSGGLYPISREPVQFTGKDDDSADQSFSEISGFRPFYMDKYDMEADMDSPENPKNNMIQFFDMEKMSEFLHLDISTRTFYLIDSYRTIIAYRSPGMFNVEAYDLISLGANGKVGNTTVDWSGGHKISEGDAKELGTGDDLSN